MLVTDLDIVKRLKRANSILSTRDKATVGGLLGNCEGDGESIIIHSLHTAIRSIKNESDEPMLFTTLVSSTVDLIANEYIYYIVLKAIAAHGSKDNMKLLDHLTRTSPWLKKEDFTPGKPANAHICRLLFDHQLAPILRKPLMDTFGCFRPRDVMDVLQNRFKALHKLVFYFFRRLGDTEYFVFEKRRSTSDRKKMVYVFYKQGSETLVPMEKLSLEPYPMSRHHSDIEIKSSDDFLFATVERAGQTCFNYNFDYLAALETLFNRGNKAIRDYVLTGHHGGSSLPAGKRDKINNIRQSLNEVFESSDEIQRQGWYCYFGLDYRGRLYPKADGSGVTPISADELRQALVLNDMKPLGATGYRHIIECAANAWSQSHLIFDDRYTFGLKHLATFENIGRKLLSADPTERLEGWLIIKDSKMDGFKCKEVAEMAKLAIELARIADSTVPVADFMTGCLLGHDATSSGLQLYAGFTKNLDIAVLSNLISTTGRAKVVNAIYSLMGEKLSLRLEAKDPLGVLGFWAGLSPADQKGISKSLLIPAIYTCGEEKAVLALKGILISDHHLDRRDRRTWAIAAGITGAFFNVWRTDSIFSSPNKMMRLFQQLAVRSGYRPNLRIPGMMEFKGHDVVIDITVTTRTQLKLYQSKGLPVLRCETYGLNIGNITESKILAGTVDAKKINVKKVKSAIAPAFIHAMDSWILCYATLKTGAQLGLIHDCLLAHPADIPMVRSCIGDAFKDLFCTGQTIIQDVIDNCCVNAVTKPVVIPAEMIALPEFTTEQVDDAPEKWS